jgi:hypothetical protein
MGLLKSKPAWAESAVGDTWAPSGGIFAKLPILWEYLQAEAYEDGTKRQPSALSVFVEGRVCKVALNDKDVQRSLYASGDTVEEALKALERFLALPKPDWRRWAGKKK